MRQRREDAPLAPQPPADVVRGAEAPNQLQRAFLHELAVGSLDEIDRPHAAVANLTNHAPDADALVDREVAAPVRFDAGERPPQQLRRERCRLEERRRCRGQTEELFDLRPAGRIGGAVRVQERRPRAGRERQRRVEQRVDLGPAPVARHCRPSGKPAPSAFSSHARARIQSRCTVRTEVSSAAAVSSSVSPAKYPAFDDAREAGVQSLE